MTMERVLAVLGAVAEEAEVRGTGHHRVSALELDPAGTAVAGTSIADEELSASSRAEGQARRPKVAGPEAAYRVGSAPRGGPFR